MLLHVAGALEATKTTIRGFFVPVMEVLSGWSNLEKDRFKFAALSDLRPVCFQCKQSVFIFIIIIIIERWVATPFGKSCEHVLSVVPAVMEIFELPPPNPFLLFVVLFS